MRVIKIGTKLDDIHILTIEDRLADLQEIVEGYIEIAHIPSLEKLGLELIVNEEGLLKGLDVNENLLPFFYVGNAMFVSKGIKGLSTDQTATALDFLAKLRKACEIEG